MPPCHLDRLVPIVADEGVELIGESVPPPAGWVSRALYVGAAGAGNWLAVVAEPNYPLRDPSRHGLHANRAAALQGRRVATFVSLGPGDGRHDLDLIQGLRAFESGKLRYIPVEISLPLLQTAIDHLRPHVEIPVGILGDFEDGGDFLADTLRHYVQAPTLFALLGGTLGNLDTGEQRFFAWLRPLLAVGDAMLLDVPLAGPGWTLADEPRLKPEAYSLAFRRFLAQAMDRNDPLGAAAEFERRAELTHAPNADLGAEVISVADRTSRRPLLTFRRYRWEPMLEWLQSQGFNIAFARSSIASDQDKFGMGVVLLTRLEN